jgi:hypothetical protein
MESGAARAGHQRSCTARQAGDVGQDGYFPRGAEAMRQGGSRRERGRGAVRAARALAKEKGWPLRWGPVEAPGVPYDAAKMFSHPNCVKALGGAGSDRGLCRTCLSGRYTPTHFFSSYLSPGFSFFLM